MASPPQLFQGLPHLPIQQTPSLFFLFFPSLENKQTRKRVEHITHCYLSLCPGNSMLNSLRPG